MPARIRSFVVLVLVLGLGLIGTSAEAANTVAFTGIEVEGSTATVEGTAEFPAITTPESVLGSEATFGTGNLPQAVLEPAGLWLTGAQVVPIAGGLRFIWQVADMPPQMPPEGVRYNWAVNIGDNVYQLQAKRTSMASVNIVEDPKGHAEQLLGQQSFFQLRGNCVTNYFPPPAPAVNGCYHYAFLNGSFDVANRRVTMDWPYETKDSINRIVAPDFKPGAVLTAHDGSRSAGMSIAASFQAVVSNQNVSRWVNGWEPYYVGGRVQLAVGSHTLNPANANYGEAVSSTSGAFSATVTGLSAANNTIFARACNGATCAYTQQRVIF